MGGKQATEKVVRQLKTEESRKLSSSPSMEDAEPQKRGTAKPQQRTISRSNMFKRF